MLAHAELAVFPKVKVFRTALQCLAENLPVHQDCTERIRINVGGYNVPDADLLLKAPDLIAEAGDGEVRAGCPELNLIEKIGNQAAMGRHTDGRVRKESAVQMSDGPIQPLGHYGIQGFQESRHLRLNGAACRQQMALNPEGRGRMRQFGRSFLCTHIHPEIAPGLVRGLAGVSAEQHGAFQRHVLMPCEKEIEVQIPADLPGAVFPGIGELLPGAEIILEAAVVDTYCELRSFRFQIFKSGTGGGDRIGDGDPCEMLGGFPKIDEVRDNPGETDPEPV